jgi:hypothetical protein
MRCYFHLVNGQQTILDNAGVNVPDFQTAQREALKAIEEILQEVHAANQDWEGWRLNVICPQGSVLFSLRLDEAARRTW